ncbi:sulfotransferase family 2 domain-containing protein [Epibacterium ulvae]|uniref:sulfotransferase family 2 domain-containing protein n=1 Tax=Epibacterium ulvae TaxID=1156985 RepID=UPI00248F992B|nr:sulfotransferase family 2 domain-containing protein [Epibacterium ulvae]
MLVFLKENLVLLSVPKTGTTALHEALKDRADIVISNPPELKHSPVYRYNRWFRPMFSKVCDKEPELCAVVREPISWLGSWYRYRQRPLIDGQPTSTKGVSFDDFVHSYCRGKQPPYANIGSQAKFLETQPNGCAVQHLFRYENLNAYHQFLQARLATTLDTKKTNVSPSGDLSLSMKTEALFRRKKPEEFELYNSVT